MPHEGKSTTDELHIKRPIKDEAKLNKIVSLAHTGIPSLAFHERYWLAIALPQAPASNSRILLHIPAAVSLEETKSACVWHGSQGGGHEEMWCVSGQWLHPGRGVQTRFLLS